MPCPKFLSKITTVALTYPVPRTDICGQAVYVFFDIGVLNPELILQCLDEIQKLADKSALYATLSYRNIINRYSSLNKPPEFNTIVLTKCLIATEATAKENPRAAMYNYSEIATAQPKLANQCFDKIKELAHLDPKNAMWSYYEVADKYRYLTPKCLEEIKKLAHLAPRYSKSCFQINCP